VAKIILFQRYKDEQRVRPVGHPLLKRGPRGKALLDRNQVWVEGHTNKLWVVMNYEDGLQYGTYTHRVWLRPYDARERRGEKRSRELSELTLRSIMRVWEDAFDSDPSLVEKLRSAKIPPEAV